jgi:hypothetical protein
VTPPGFEIRTPIAQPLFRLVFENLPILRFQELMPQLKGKQRLETWSVRKLTTPIYLELIRPFETGSLELTLFLGKLQQTNNPDSALPIINSLLPNSAFLEEPCATGLAIERFDQLSSVEFFNLMAFLISNNFPGESTSRSIYKWLKKYSAPIILKILSTIATPTTEALLNNFFRCAVEAGDVLVVKNLIRAGVSPNGHVCRHPSLPDHVTPLQFALCRGNTQLAQELIEAGSSIDEVGAGWKSNALVLAIIGTNLRGHPWFWKFYNDSSDYGDEEDVIIDIFENESRDLAVQEADKVALFALFNP